MATPDPCPGPLSSDLRADEVGESAGSLLIDSLSRPTDRPTFGTEVIPYPTYLSGRVTIDHSKWDDVQNCLHDFDYIVFPHVGTATRKEHFHFFIPYEFEHHGTIADRIRKRFRDGLGLAGNGNFSIKSMSNGMWNAVQYGSKEGTVAFVSDDAMRCFVDAAPSWVSAPQTGQRLLPLAKEERSAKDWQLTYTNLVTQAVMHARKHALTCSLKFVVKHMIETTKWRPSKYLLTGGVPEFYENDYAFRTGRRKDQDMAWWQPRF